LGGFIGGSLGVAGTLVTSYFGPRKLEEWREIGIPTLRIEAARDVIVA